MKRPETVIVRAAAVWTAVGLAGGLGYRELTRSETFTGWTQLSVVHTHALVLGTVMLLVVLGLQRGFGLSQDRRLRWFLWVWNVGLALTVAGLTVKGTLQVIGSSAAESPAIAGFSGLGHILLTVAFVLLFLVLGARARAAEADRAETDRAEADRAEADRAEAGTVEAGTVEAVRR
jgi:nitric oxide reductase large subunit